MKDGMSFMRNGGKGDGKNKISKLPIDIKIGRAEAAIPCVSCKHLSPAGFYVLIHSDAILVCMKCAITAIFKHQEANPLEKLFEVDLNAHPEDYKKAADAVRSKMPELSESKAMELAEAAINAI